jgi:hypothetical protein
VSVNVTVPELLNVTLGVVIVNEPMFPKLLVNVSEDVPVIVPDPEIEPLPVAVIMSIGLEMFAFTRTPPVPPVQVKVMLAVADKVLDSVIAVVLLAESVNTKLAPVEAPLPVIAVVSLRVTLPVVLAVMFWVANVSEPIAPEPVPTFTDVVPDIVPEPVIVPTPVAVIVSMVPDTLALMAMLLLPPLANSVSAPLAVIELVKVIAVVPTAVSVRLKLFPVDGPF